MYNDYGSFPFANLALDTCLLTNYICPMEMYTLDRLLYSHFVVFRGPLIYLSRPPSLNSATMPRAITTTLKALQKAVKDYKDAESASVLDELKTLILEVVSGGPAFSDAPLPLFFVNQTLRSLLLYTAILEARR